MSEGLPGRFVRAQGDTAFFTQAEVQQALRLFVSDEEAAQIAAEFYEIEPESSGIGFDDMLFSALESLSPDLARRVAEQLAESKEEAAARRSRFAEMQSGSGS